MAHQITVRCPHCQSTDVHQSSVGGIAIATVRPIYYIEWECNQCHEAFVVKSDDENPVRAIIANYRVGGYYDDGIGLDEQSSE